MKIWNALKKRLNSRTSGKSSIYWDSISEFPVYNWIKCQEGKLHYVNKSEKLLPTDYEQWIKLYNEYLSRYGLSDLMDRYMEAKRRVASLRLEFIKTGDEFLFNQIAIEEKTIEDLDPTKLNGLSYEQILSYVRKYTGIWVNARQISVTELKETFEEYVRSNKKE